MPIISSIINETFEFLNPKYRNLRVFSLIFGAKIQIIEVEKKYLIYGTAFVWQKKSTNTASVNYKTSVFSN